MQYRQSIPVTRSPDCVLSRGPGWFRELGSWLKPYLTTHTSLSPIRRGFAPNLVNYKKGAFDLQPQVM